MKREDFLKITGVAMTGFFASPVFNTLSFSNPGELPPILMDSNGNPIKSVAEWNEHKKTIIQRWSNYLGMIDPNPAQPVLNIINEDKPENLIRQYVEYEGEPGLMVTAYILKPQRITRRLPGVVALHSTSDNQMKYIAGVEKGNIVALGYNLAKMGFVVICPMCFLWREKGERTYDQQVDIFHNRHPSSKGMAKMLFDAQRAVDVLLNMDEVDGSLIGAMGHSLGGKEAFYLGAFDERVKVIVSNEGGIGIDFSNWDASWYLGKEIHSFNHLHHEVLALCAPKPFFLIGGDSSDGEKSIPYINAVKPVYRLYRRPENLRFYNHRKGHNITPLAEKRTYDWMFKHLKQSNGTRIL